MLIRSTSMTIYAKKPYTYLIGWSKLDKWYYGVRYSKHARTDELWVKYFTSSKHVARFRNKHGDPDVIQIRKIFETAEIAIAWEQSVLKRLNVEKNPRFLNAKNDTTKKPTTFPESSRFKKGNVPHNKGKNYKSLMTEDERKQKWGRKKTEEEKNLARIRGKEYFENEDRREEWKNRSVQQFQCPIKRAKHLAACINHSDKIWINDGVKNKRVREEDVGKYDGWVRGRLIPRHQIDTMINNRTTTRDCLTGKFMKKKE
jgi:hypothetical protein